MNILLIEDSRDLALNMVDFFESKGSTVDVASDGVSGLHLAASNNYDVIILDLMLPGIDGLTICRRLRESGKQKPILILTARDSLEDKIIGLEAGADDYVIKPAALREIEARLVALIRRSKTREGPARLQVGDLTFDPGTMKVTRGKLAIDLPPIPLRILETLLRHSPRVVSREELERSVWGDSPPDSDALRAHLHILRQAINRHSDHSLIRTLRGIGYQIVDETDDANDAA